MKKNDDDEEAQHPPVERKINVSDDDDDVFLDEMNVEDWLAKRQEMEERGIVNARNGTLGPLDTPGAVEDSSMTDRVNAKAAALLKHHDAAERSKETELPVVGTANITSNERKVSQMSVQTHEVAVTTYQAEGSRRDIDDTPSVTDVGMPAEVLLNATIRVVDNNPPTANDFYVAELCRTQNDNVLLIEGVKTVDPRIRRICLAVGFLVLLSIVSVVAAKITSWISSTSGSSSTSPGDLQGNATTMPPVLFPRSENLNWTLADSIVRYEKAGGIIGWYVSTINGKIYLDMINRTDTNFTIISMSNDLNIFVDSDFSSSLTGIVTPLWYGHLTNVFEHYIVEGQTVGLEDMYDGMVLMSLAGYPLTIQVNPLRVNNVSLSLSESNEFYKNGVGHHLVRFPSPIVPFAGKSSFEMLLATNELLQGQLSKFIALIDSSPDLKSTLESREGYSKAVTLFVPTNSAFATLDPDLLADDGYAQSLLLNHSVSGNFVKHRWWVIPTGTKMSDTELKLVTIGGQVLNLTIHDVVTINDHATIIRPDIFTEGGVLHVIDKLL